MVADFPHSPVVWTVDPDLRDEVERLSAACGQTVDRADDLAGLRRTWRQAPCVMVGVDRLDALVAAALPRRERVVLVGFGPEDATWWRRAVEARIDHVVVLPEAHETLLRLITDVADGGAGTATTVAVVGAGGGAGASTLAVVIGLTAAAQGHRSTLIDLDPDGAGVDLVLGAEAHDGLRWTDLAASHGRLGAAALRSALPEVDGLPVLTFGPDARSSLGSETAQAVLDAAARSSDLVVLDVPRRPDEAATEALATADVTLVATRPDVCSAAAAVRVAGQVRRWCHDVRLVVRTRRRGAATGALLAEQLGLPLAGTVPTRPAVVGSVNDGLGPVRRTRLDRAVRPLVADLLAHGGVT